MKLKNKHYCNPLDPNSTLNMDNGSGNLTNTKNKSGGSFRNKGNNILPPTTKVRLNGAGRQVMNANVAGGNGAYLTYGGAGGRKAKSGAGGDGSIPNAYPKCKHIEGEMEEYDNLGMYHIASGVCKKCGMSMVDWDKNNKDNGGRKHSGKATPKVHLSKREEFGDFLVYITNPKNYDNGRPVWKGIKYLTLLNCISDYHISEMKALLERVGKINYPKFKCKKGTFNQMWVRGFNDGIEEYDRNFRRELNSLEEELK